MCSKGFYLLVENTYESCYLISRFIDQFKYSGEFLGVLVAEDRPPRSILEGRELFHSEYGGRKDWDIVESAGTTPAGILHDPDLRGQNYMYKDFTTEKRRQAEEGYLWMKSQSKIMVHSEKTSGLISQC